MKFTSSCWVHDVCHVWSTSAPSQGGLLRRPCELVETLKELSGRFGVAKLGVEEVGFFAMVGAGDFDTPAAFLPSI